MFSATNTEITSLKQEKSYFICAKQKIRNIILTISKARVETYITQLITMTCLSIYYGIHVHHHRAREQNSLIKSVCYGLFEGTARLTAFGLICAISVMLNKKLESFDVVLLGNILCPSTF